VNGTSIGAQVGHAAQKALPCAVAGRETMMAMRISIVALSLLVAAPLHAQSYTGVTPGSDVLPEGIAAAPGQGALVTWPGFQMLAEGGSRVFVQTSTEVTPELKRDGLDGWSLTLPGVKLPEGNARRPLDTHYFNTPVKAVRALHRGKGVAVLLDMRAKLTPTVRTERASNGYFFVYLEFPPGNFI
jgi:hypothetical protein